MTRRTRRFVWIAIAALLFAIFAGSYAWYRSYVAQQLAASLNNWILARTAEGYRIDADFSEPGGSLASVVSQLDRVRIVAPGDYWDFTMPRLVVVVNTYNPFGVHFQMVGSPELRYSVSDEDFHIQAVLHTASAGFTYSTEGIVSSAYLSAFSSAIHGPVDFSFKSFDAQASFDPAAPLSNTGKSVEFKLSLAEAVIAEPANLPLGDLIKRVDVDAYVAGTLRPGRPSESLAAWRDGGGVLQIQRFVANWGPLAITAEGTLALDAQLQPLFAGTAMVRGYNETIDAMAQAGMMELGQVTGAKIALAAMTKPADDGGPPAAKLPITIQDGFLFVGPLKLARMPRIVWQ